MSSRVFLERKKKVFKKNKGLTKVLSSSESDEECNVRELSHYKSDKIKMMKEVLKILKPKKIKSMAPDCIKHLDIEEINAVLLEELLGISNKRLGYIFNGENPDRESSSSESDEDKAVEVISLDDISDDDLEVCLESDNKDNVKKELKRKHKKHKSTEKSNKTPKKEDENEKLMSVLELLELQARARAIRSQLALEAANKKDNVLPKEEQKSEEDDEDAVIVESPKRDEIVIESSESEPENNEKTVENVPKIQDDNVPETQDVDVPQTQDDNVTRNEPKVKQKVKIIRDWSIQNDILKNNLLTDKNTENNVLTADEKNKENDGEKDTENNLLTAVEKNKESDGEKNKESDGEKTEEEVHEVEKNIKEEKVNENKEKNILQSHQQIDNQCDNCDEIVIINLDEDEIDEVEQS